MRTTIALATSAALICVGFAVASSEGAQLAERSTTARTPKAPAAHDVWVIVKGLDTDANGKPDRVHVQYQLPERGATNVPSILEASPYYAGGNDVRNHNVDVKHLYVPPRQPGSIAAFSSGYQDLLQPHGYAYVFAESIGSGESTGCPSSGGRDETRGMTAVVKWLTGHAKAVNAAGHRVKATWSSGHVGMIGVSYNGTLANAVASTGVEGLDAIVPISSISSWYDYYRSQGAVRAPGGYQGEDEDVLAKFVLTRANADVCTPAIKKLAHDMGRKTGDYTSFWRSRNYRTHAGRVHAAVLSLHGLADWNVMNDQTGRWLRALDRAGVPTMSWWHTHSHGDWLLGGKTGWDQLLVDWFDHWLKGKHNGVMQRPANVVGFDSGKTWSSKSWPMPRSHIVRLHPSGAGRGAGGLRSGPAKGVGRIVDDASFSMRDLANKAHSAHRLLFQTKALARRVTLSGLASADVAVSFDAKASNLSVGLADISPGGHAHVVSEGWMDPQNHRSLATGEALVPGKVYHLHVDFDMVLQNRIAAGHRLALVIAASDRNYTLRPPPGTKLTVRLRGSTLNLPAVGNSLHTPAASGSTHPVSCSHRSALLG